MMLDGVRVQLWQLVTSRAGRDTGQAYLVSGLGEEGFVSLTDGERRRIESPKRKNIRHLVVYDMCAEDLAAKSTSGQPIRNAEVRIALKSLAVDAGLVAAEPQTARSQDSAGNTF